MASQVPLAMGFQGVALSHVPRDHFFVSGTSATMRALERVMANIARTDIPILLVGESGTGKEEVAVRIHQMSRRQSKGFVKLICASLTSELLDQLAPEVGESGGVAYTAADGTLFFDEVSELGPNCQARLLHCLPDGDAVPNARVLRARIISSTSLDIEQEVRTGRFRKELYYRLKGISLRLPPLRERKEDVPALVDFFLAKHSELLARPRPPVSPHTIRLMQEYPWPGNIRELENVVKKLVAVGDETVTFSDLHAGAASVAGSSASSGPVSLKEAARAASRQAERELIQQVLTRVRWNRKRAAQELQISYKALLYKLKQMGLDGSGL
jgi:DNA-binding NtrC family response regulator